MSNQSNIERIVMRRVRAIRMLRPIISADVLAALVLVLALWGIGREVWVARVFANGPQDAIGHALYLAYAFEHTRIIVQMLTLTTATALIYLARETARVLPSLFAPTPAIT